MKSLFVYFLSITLLSASTWQDIKSPIETLTVLNVNPGNIESTVLEFEIDGFHLLPVNTLDGEMSLARLADGASLLELGSPDMHKYARSIVIPDDMQMAIKVLSSEFVDYENILIAPSKGNLSRNIDPDNVDFEFGDVYQKDAFYPGELVELESPYILRDVRGQSIVFYPFQYNPIQKVLRVYRNIKVEVYVSGPGSINVFNRASIQPVYSKEFLNIYKNHFMNYSNDTRFDYLVDHGNLLVISYGSFMETVQPLVDWKNRKGISTEMVNISDIGSNSTSISNFVADYYSDNGLTFLLLVGDIAQMPSPSVGGSSSDMSYGCISGNDFYAEVIVGRFSGSTPSQIATQVERSIEYEYDPQSDAEWYDNALGIASNQGPGFGGYTDDQFNDFMWDTVLSDFTYDSYDGIYDGSGGTDSQGINAINSGIGLINYTGHGSISSWGNGASLSTSQINSLTNNNRLPFVITVGCNVGEFQSTNECFCEAWMRATNGGEPTGAISHFGSTISQSWEPPMHGQYGMMLVLTEAYDDHLTRTMGGITTNGCMYMNDAQGSSGINETKYWTYFGDPTVPVRTAPPTTMNVNHDDLVILGSTEFSVNTGSEGDLAALSRDGELLASGYTDGFGNINLYLGNAATEPGELDLVVTGFNRFPYENTVMVLSPEGEFVTVNGVNVDLGSDNTITPGETIDVTVEIENVGNIASEGVTVSLIDLNDNPYISIVDGSNYLNSLLVGSTSFMDLSFNVSNDVPFGHSFSLQIVLESTENNWSTTLTMTVQALVESFEGGTFSDLDWELSGNAFWSIDSDQYYEGGYSARSGTIGDNTLSTLQLTINIVEAGSISFHKRVSCEDVGSSTGTYYDYLAFYIDDVEQGRWAGEVAWSQSSYNVSAGEHIFKWTFIKDQDSSEDVESGEDAVWIDNIIFPPAYMESEGTPGDVNMDGIINILDVIVMMNMILNIEDESSLADLNGDGTINIQDIILVINLILSDDGLSRSGYIQDAQINMTPNKLSISANSTIAGIELHTAGDYAISNKIMPEGWRFYQNDHTIVMVDLEGKGIDGPIELEFDGELIIQENILSDWCGHGISATVNMIPDKVVLNTVYPNPFNPVTSINYTLSKMDHVTLSVYNLTGQLIETLVSGYQDVGIYEMIWDASFQPSGMYFLRLQTTGEVHNQKLMLIK